jgi:thioesterase domain-containing protein
MGGLLAAHTAAHLERRGREVGFVGVIECDPGGMDDGRGRTARLTRFVCESYELIRRETGLLEEVDPHTLEREAREVAGRLEPQAVADWILESGHIAAGVPRGLVTDQFRRIGRDLVLMAEDGGRAGEPLLAPIGLWSAADGMGAGVELWQSRTTGECSHTVLDGEHFSVMFPPHVETLAAQMAAALELLGTRDEQGVICQGKRG